MADPQYTFTHATGFYFRTRAIGFIEETVMGKLDAKGVYDGLKPKARSTVNTRFQHWLDRMIYQKYFHGFSGDYDLCFTFKWEDRHIPQRLYGFICKPKPYTDPDFELC